MSEKTTNTTKSVTESKVSDAQLQADIKRAAQIFKGEKMKSVSINKNYQKFIGTELPMRINGVLIVLPVDGTKHNVPETFANHIEDYLSNITM
jgi:hypothetical protein